jgi:hypothetical protein
MNYNQLKIKRRIYVEITNNNKGLNQKERKLKPQPKQS